MTRVVQREGTLYPQLPPGTQRVLRISETGLTAFDRAAVALSSLIIVGSVAWVPAFYAWAWRRWSQIPKEQKRRRMVYGALLISLLAMGPLAPHHAKKLGKWSDFSRWSLWRSWIRFVAVEVLTEAAPTSSQPFDRVTDQSILAIIPHGIFPFALGVSFIPEELRQALGIFKPVVAPAVAFLPFVRTIISWCGKVFADLGSVDAALTRGDRIGMAPGGIAEIFEGYPKPGTHPDEEYAIIQRRKGFIRMAIKHRIPVLPIYCFGATKMLKRLQLPEFFETISNALHVSLVLAFGVWGLPMPFRQKLLYVLGNPIHPPSAAATADGAMFEQQVDVMHEQFCNELTRLFEKYKDYYGWDRKVLKLV